MNRRLAMEGVSHRYGDLVALAEVDLVANGGEVLGLVGRNGAGKTTLIRLMTRLIDLQSGRREADTTIGYVPQRLIVWPDLTVREQLEFIADMQEVPRERAAAAARRLGLGDKLETLAAHLSGGMQRRLSIAIAVVDAPGVLVLDEPHIGLDPASRQALRAYLRELADQGCAVVLSSHALDEVERLADRVVMLENGRIIAEGSPSELAGDGRLEDRFVS